MVLGGVGSLKSVALSQIGEKGPEVENSACTEDGSWGSAPGLHPEKQLPWGREALTPAVPPDLAPPFWGRTPHPGALSVAHLAYWASGLTELIRGHRERLTDVPAYSLLSTLPSWSGCILSEPGTGSVTGKVRLQWAHLLTHSSTSRNVSYK